MAKTQKIERKEKTVKPTVDKKAKFAKVGFILGIIAICTSIIFAGAIVGVPGIVFSALGSKSADPVGQKKSKIGMILSIIGVAIGVTLFFVFQFVILDLIYQQGGHPIGG